MLAAFLDSVAPCPPSTGPLFEEAVFFAASAGVPSALTPARLRRRLAREARRAITEYPLGLPALKRRLAALEGLPPGGGERIETFLAAVCRLGAPPETRVAAAWPLSKWTDAFAQAGLGRDAGRTFVSLVLGREEHLPEGPAFAPMYRRLGISLDVAGRLRRPPFTPQDSSRLRWLLADLALSRCTPGLSPGGCACLSCPARLFCLEGRKAVAGRTAPGRHGAAPEFIDLFAGGGGLSLGFRLAGFRQRVAVETDEHAADSLYLNHPEAAFTDVVRRDVRRLEANSAFIALHKGVPLLVGGPPCQPYSMAHRHNRPDRLDGRRFLYRPFVRLGKALGVKMIVMENVPGLRTAAGGKMLRRVLSLFEGAGFEVEYRVLDSSKFGVPQRRERMFFVALDRKCWKDPKGALARFWASVERGGRRPEVSLREALSGLPVVGPGEGGDAVRKRHRGPTTRYGRVMGSGAAFAFNHEARAHNPRDLEIFSKLRRGEIAKRLEQREPGLIPYQLQSFPDKFRKLRPSSPSPTIPAHLSRDANSFVHPWIPRGITCREAARLQSFPDDYVFLGGFGPAFIQTGNAVPPLLSRVVARAARSLLEAGEPEETPSHRRRVAVQVALPDDGDAPPLSTELVGDSCVTLPVPGEFVGPEPGPGAGGDVVARAPMPEAAVHQNCHSSARKNQVRLSREIRVAAVPHASLAKS
jgi:DNA (cytosine-5)-methyltransferase 1